MSSLKEVIFTSVVGIRRDAFKGCSNLESVSLPMVKRVCRDAFNGCKELKNVNLPQAKTIDQHAFMSCEKLENISLPNVKTVGIEAFKDCKALETVSLPIVQTIQDSAFNSDSSLVEVILGANVPAIGANTFFDSGTDSSYIIVPSGSIVTYLADGADGNNTDSKWYGFTVTSINDATLSKLSISQGALTFNSSIKEYTVNVENNVTSIDVTAITNNTKATVAIEGEPVTRGTSKKAPLKVGINKINIVVTAQDGNTTSETVITVVRYGGGKLTIDGFTTGSLASAIKVFYRPITSLTITDGIVNATDFELIKSLGELEVLEISGNARVHSTGDTSVSTPDNKVPAFAFRDCTSLKTVSLPSVINIDEYAFYGCQGLESISLPKAKTIGKGAFINNDSLTSISLPDLETVADMAFKENASLKTVSLPSVINIGESAFNGCQGLESISLPNVKTIGVGAFYNNDSLTNISLPNLETMGIMAFMGCDGLESISLPKVNAIVEYAFFNCKSLKELELGVSVPSVGTAAFKKISGDSKNLIVPSGSLVSYLADKTDGNDTDNKWYGFTVTSKQ